MLSKCNFNSHLLLLKFHAIDIIISIVFDDPTHLSEAMVIVGGTSEALELTIWLPADQLITV